METKRQRQVAEQVKRHFGMMLQQEGSLIYGSQVLVTVTNVVMSPDLRLAKVYLSVYNTDNKQAIILMLQEEHQQLRGALYHRLRRHVRFFPEFDLYLDDTLDEMYRLNQIFNSLEEEPPDAADREEVEGE
ncbi:MAG: 30S ribosome-binding factor RbfA [Bacteroidota bacterium]